MLVLGAAAVGGPDPTALRTASTTNPTPPTGVQATPGNGALVISWNPVAETALTGYRVYFNGTLRATVTGTATTATVTGLTNGQLYTGITVRTTTQQFIIPYEGVDSAPTSGTPHNGLPPAAPAGFTATASDRQVSLAWSAPADLEVRSWELRRDGVLIATPSLPATSYVDTGRTNGVAHTYTLVAVDVAAMKSTSSTASATPRDGVAPTAPTGLAATAGDGTVALTWTANPEYDVAEYRIRRDGVQVATVTGTGWTDTGLTNGVAHAYSIEAVDTSGNVSAASSPPVSATPHDGQPPAAPAGLTATAGDRQVDLSWTAASDPEVRGYEVRRDGVLVATLPAAATTWTDTGLGNGVARSYTLIAVDVAGMRSPPATSSATPFDTVAPDTPTGLVAVPGDERIALSWTPNAEDDVAEYVVHRDGVPVVTVSGISWVDTGRTNGVEHEYRLAVRDTSGNESPLSDEAVYATAHDGLPPDPPADLAATPSDRQVALSWTASSDPEVRGYELRRGGVLVASLPPGDTTWTDTGLVNGVAYTYELVAVDVAAEVSAPATVAATPRDADAPAPPTGLAAIGGDREVALSWTDGSEYDIDFYRVLRNGTEVAVVVGTSWTDPGVTNGTTYSYAVVAVDTSGNASDPSDPATAIPRDAGPPAAPTGLAATPGDRQVELTWDAAPEVDVVSYRVWRDGVQVAVVSDPTFTDTGLTNGVPYEYAVMAVDDSGNDSAPSDPVPATPVDLDPPAVPTGLAARPSDGAVTLSWDDPAEYDLDGYRVLRDGVEVAFVSGSPWTDSGLTNGVEVVYTLVAVDTSGNESAPSDPAAATPAEGPAAPTGLVAVAGDGQVSLTWDANAEPDLDRYVLLRDGAEIAEPTGTSYVDTDVVNGTTYVYTLVAVDTVDRSSPESEPAEATPFDAPPAAPTDVTASPGDARAVVRWTASPEPDVVAYRVYSDDGTLAVEVAAPATSATVRGLTNGEAARFLVVAVDAADGESLPSDEVEVTPVLAPVGVPPQGTGTSGGIAVSSDGRHLVIGTRARLEASDTNTAYELYVVDRDAGTRRRVAPLPATSTSTTDVTNGSAPAISDDGRYVVLATTQKLLPADTNTLSDLYRLDTSTWTWSLVSVPASGAVHRTVAGTLAHTGASVYSKSPPVAVSGDGDLVLFYSNRPDLVAGDTNAKVDVFAKRMSTGAVTRVSTTATGAGMTRVPTGPALALTPDGRFALFPAVTGTGPAVLYRKTLSGADAGALTAVSTVVASGRTTEFGVVRDAGDIAISDDGRSVAFVTSAKLGTTTPTANWTAGLAYRKDLDDGTIVALGTGQRTVWEHTVELDPTGRYAFYSTAAPALPGDTNGHTDVHRRDLDGGVAGPLVLVTANASGTHTTGPTGSVAPTEYVRVFALSGDEVVLTTSQALAPVDANKLRDLYAKDLSDGAVRTPLA